MFAFAGSRRAHESPNRECLPPSQLVAPFNGDARSVAYLWRHSGSGRTADWPGRAVRIELEDIRGRVPVLQRERSHRSEEHTSELQSPCNLVCRLLLEKKK